MKKSLEDNHSKKNIFLSLFLPLFLIWQICILLVPIFSGRILVPRERFMYNDGPKIFNPQFLWSRANFDGIHYLEIARKGYGVHQQAFFPFYPNLIRKLTPFFLGKDLLAAVFISNLFFFLAFWLFYQLILIDYESKIALKSLIFYLIFPTSFFFTMVYTESLFLALVLSSFYFARKKRWFWAGVLGALASNTRLVGIFLFPALLWEWWEQQKGHQLKLKTESIKPLASIFLVPLGLWSYMKFLAAKYHDPLMFFHVQPFFGAERSGGKIILIYQVFWRYLKMVLTTRIDPLYFSVWLELLTAIGFIAVSFLAYRKKMRLSYLIFALFAYLAPTLSGTFSSMPRYVLVLFPCFIYFGMIRNKFITSLLTILFVILLMFSVIYFLNGYWIA